MIKNIVFDFGGVIADISREQAVKAFIRLGVKDADRILDKYHQTGIFQELEEGSLTEEAYRNELGKLCGRTLSWDCLLYTSPSPRDYAASRMPSSA